MTIRLINSPDDHYDCFVQNVNANFENEKWIFKFNEKEDAVNFENFLHSMNINFMVESDLNCGVDYTTIIVKANQNNFLII